MNLKTYVRIIFTIFISLLEYLVGGFDNGIKTLLIFMLLDYITGICKAIVNKKIKSVIGIKGIIKKIGYLILVALSVQLDNITGGTGALRTLVIYFFVANEGISILENWGSIGLPMPKKLMETLEQLKKENGGNENEKGK